MNFGQSSPLGIALEVWSAATRKLTSMGTAMGLATSVNQTLAAATSTGFAPSAGAVAFFTVGMLAGAAGTLVARWVDGVNTFNAQTVTAGQTGVLLNGVSSSGFNLNIINNDAVNAAKYSYNEYVILVG